METKRPQRVERLENGEIVRVKKEIDESQTVKEQIQIVTIKGVLLGIITSKTTFKDAVELIKKTKHYTVFLINNKEERIQEYDLINGDEVDFPINIWLFPDSKSIKERVYEDLPF